MSRVKRRHEIEYLASQVKSWRIEKQCAMLPENDIERARSTSLTDMVAGLRRVGAEHVGPCPVCGGTDRFSINSRKQVWNCRGCQVGGDAIALAMHLHDVNFRTAVEMLAGPSLTPALPRIEIIVPPAQRPDDPSERKFQALAMNTWNNAGPIAGTLAETYLASRRLAFDDPDGDVLRFHPACTFGPNTKLPCMVTIVRNIITNEPQAIHRTALTPDGRKIDRMALGPIGGGAVKLTDDADVTHVIAIGEGIETTLSIRLLPGLSTMPVWSVLNANGISSFPVLPEIQSVWIAVDNDASGTGEKAARALTQSMNAAGVETVCIEPPHVGNDLNDVVRHA